jgi:hypothetical protein
VARFSFISLGTIGASRWLERSHETIALTWIRRILAARSFDWSPSGLAPVNRYSITSVGRTSISLAVGSYAAVLSENERQLLTAVGWERLSENLHPGFVRRFIVLEPIENT